LLSTINTTCIEMSIHRIELFDLFVQNIDRSDKEKEL